MSIAVRRTRWFALAGAATALLLATAQAGPAAAAAGKAKTDSAVEHGDLRLDTDSPTTLAWADRETARTLARLKRLPIFPAMLADARKVLTQPGRIGDLSVDGDWVYEYAQPADKPLGLWRRSPLADFITGRPRWTTLIDLDALSAREGRKLFLAGTNCRNERCLVGLSDNGRDAQETREFDLKTGDFVPGGFRIPASKSRAWWYDADTLLVAPALDPAGMTEHRLPKNIRLWRRGTPLATARRVFSIGARDAMIGAMMAKAAGQDGFVAVRHPDFVRGEYTLVQLDGSRRPLPLPDRATFLGGHAGMLLIRPDAPWRIAGGPAFRAGDVVGVPMAPLLREGSVAGAKLIYSPEAGEAVVEAAGGDDTLVLGTLDGYVSRLVELRPAGEGWTARRIPALAPYMQILSRSGQELLLRVQGPLTPDAIETLDLRTGATRRVAGQQPAFDAADLTTELLRATSRDGTPIDYLVIRKRGMAANGRNPTLVYGYGGFDVPVTPRYEPVFGKLWVERGGVYVHAYLRGGGEHGPDWHAAAMREKHVHAFEDMEAVLRDLQTRGITSSAHTGIIGRSNGGLLTATVLERSPQLMNAAIVGGPLIDMLNFHRLPPGGTWKSEYGDPDVPADRATIARYSPMQNVADAKRRYPPPLIITSRDDDRVLPGHARRFSALLTRKGHDNFYFEDRQGGHYWELAGGPAPGDWRLRATARAVEFSYLWDRLGSGGGTDHRMKETDR